MVFALLPPDLVDLRVPRPSKGFVELGYLVLQSALQFSQEIREVHCSIYQQNQSQIGLLLGKLNWYCNTFRLGV